MSSPGCSTFLCIDCILKAGKFFKEKNVGKRKSLKMFVMPTTYRVSFSSHPHLPSTCLFVSDMSSSSC